MDNLENILPKLPKKTGFKMPEGYFDSLHENVKSKIENEHAKPISKTIQLRPYLAIAASFLLIFMAWFIILQLSPFDNNTITAENDFYDLVLEDVDEELLIEVLLADNLYNTESDFADFDNEELIDYIYDDIDINLLQE